MSKAKVISIEHIPTDLGGAFNAYDRVRFLSSNKIVLSYKNSGTVVVGNLNDSKDVKVFKSASEIVQWELFPPSMIVSTHQNDTIQFINDSTGMATPCSMPKDTISKTQALLANDRRIVVTTGTTVYIWDRTNLNAPPREIPLKDNRNPKTRPIINTRSHFSSVIDADHLLLGNPDVWQVWRLSDQGNEMWVESEGRSPSGTAKFFGVWCRYPIVATYQKVDKTGPDQFTLALWDATKAPEASVPRVFNTDAFVTDMFLDDAFVVMGDSNGVVSLRSSSNGDALQELGRPDSKTLQKTPSVETGLLQLRLEHKTNFIDKIGRWVFAGFETGRVAVYDLVKSNAGPVAEYSHPKRFPAKHMWVDPNLIVLMFKEDKKAAAAAASDKKKDSKSAREFDLLAWTPKGLTGLEQYMQLTKSGESAFTMILTFNLQAITAILKKVEAEMKEEQREFTAPMADLADVIPGISTAAALGGLKWSDLSQLNMSLVDYHLLLEKHDENKQLARVFSSTRLRRNVELSNSKTNHVLREVINRVRQFLQSQQPAQPATQSPTLTTPTPAATGAPAQFVKPVTRSGSISSVSSQYAAPIAALPQAQAQYQAMQVPLPNSQQARRQTNNEYATSIPLQSMLARQSLITDEGGKIFWAQYFGDSLTVEWLQFINAMSQSFQLSEDDISKLQSILDHTDTGYVNQYKFAEFLKGFGPFAQCIQQVRDILSQRWFYGFLSSKESELLLRTAKEPIGTFLVRFSKSKPGSFALAYVQEKGVNHILIESNQPHGYSISEKKSTGASRVFASLQDIIKHYDFILKRPFESTLPSSVWFQGDLSSEEARDILSEKIQQDGTFLIRFSSKGCFAASFVSKGTVCHVLVDNDGMNSFTVTTGVGQDTITFKSLQDLVAYYYEKGVFKYPLKTLNR